MSDKTDEALAARVRDVIAQLAELMPRVAALIDENADLRAKAEAATAMLAGGVIVPVERLHEALAPFAALGGPDDGCAVAFPDLPDDTVIYQNSGRAITAGNVRAARKLVSDFYQPHAAIAGKEPRKP